jgi:pilus assembly protein Flp/PilA
MKAMKAIKTLLRNETGATAIEYALLASLIAAVIAATVGVLGGQVSNLFSSLKWW